MSKDTHGTRSIDPEKSHEPSKAEAHDDDVIHVPKGSSRARFLMTVVLLLLVLTTFTVSQEVVEVFTGAGDAKGAYMSWKRPDGTVQSMDQMDFLLVRQNVSRVESILSGGKSSKEKDDVQIARHILVNDVAEQAGVEIPDSQLREILQGFGSAEVYRQMLGHYRTNTVEFEDTLRDMLRVARYEQMLGAAAAIPDPATVLDGWKTSHKEYSLDTIELSTEGFAEEAKAACPAGDELKTWFEGLKDPEKNAIRTQIEARTSGEFAWFSLDSDASPAKLLAKFPRPAEEKPEDVAKTWYETNKDLLFRKPDLPPGKPLTPEDYVPFEEVKDKAQQQGLAYQAMLDWVNGLKAREEQGETILLSTEAPPTGLAYRREEQLHTRAGWRDAQMGWSGQSVLAAMFAPTSQAGKLLPDAIVDAKGIFVGRLLEKEESRMPAFEEFQDKAREAWIARKKGELAQAKLDLLRAKFSPAPDAPPAADPASALLVEPDAEKFKAAAAELGLEVKTQDWFDAAAAMRGGLPSPFVLFQRKVAQTSGDTVGAISPSSLAGDRSAAWLARVAGSRDPDTAKITPQEYETARQFAVFQSRSDFFDKTLGSEEFLKERYGLELELWRRRDAETVPAKP